MRWRLHAAVVLGCILSTVVGRAGSCNTRALSSCAEKYRQASARYHSLVKQNSYTKTQQFNMICRIIHTYANCSYPNLDGCYRAIVNNLDKFFAKYSACKVPSSDQRNITILPDPTVPPERRNATCDKEEVRLCLLENQGILREMLAKFAAGSYSKVARLVLICRCNILLAYGSNKWWVESHHTFHCSEGRRFSKCLYANTMGCTNPYLASIDEIVSRYNVLEYSCGIALHKNRHLNGSVKSYETKTTTGAATATSRPPSQPSARPSAPSGVTGGGRRTTTAANITATVEISTSRGPPVCRVRSTVTCDIQFRKDYAAYLKVTTDSHVPESRRVILVCKIVNDYAACTYPMIDGCFKKTLDYVDNFFATKYPNCNVTNAAARGIRFIDNPTVPPHRRAGLCNSTAVNVCVTENRARFLKMYREFEARNYTLQKEDVMICQQVHRFAACSYSKSMGCTNDYLDSVARAVETYRNFAYNCSVANYTRRHLNGTIKEMRGRGPTTTAIHNRSSTPTPLVPASAPILPTSASSMSPSISATFVKSNTSQLTGANVSIKRATSSTVIRASSESAVTAASTLRTSRTAKSTTESMAMSQMKSPSFEKQTNRPVALTTIAKTSKIMSTASANIVTSAGKSATKHGVISSETQPTLKTKRATTRIFRQMTTSHQPTHSPATFTSPTQTPGANRVKSTSVTTQGPDSPGQVQDSATPTSRGNTNIASVMALLIAGAFHIFTSSI